MSINKRVQVKTQEVFVTEDGSQFMDRESAERYQVNNDLRELFDKLDHNEFPTIAFNKMLDFMVDNRHQFKDIFDTIHPSTRPAREVFANREIC